MRIGQRRQKARPSVLFTTIKNWIASTCIFKRLYTDSTGLIFLQKSGCLHPCTDPDLLLQLISSLLIL